MKKLLSFLCLLFAVVSLALVSGADEQKATTIRPTGAATDTQSTAEAGPETFLPASAIAAFSWEGNAAHLEGLKQTAAWKALEESELNQRLLQLVSLFASAAGDEAGQLTLELIQHVRDRGVSLAAAVSGDGAGLSPYGVVVFHNAGEYLPALTPYIEQIARGARVQVESKTVSGRKVAFFNPGAPGVSVAWWEDSGHLLVAGGMLAAEQAIATTSGKSDNITKNERWNALKKSERYTVRSFGWMDPGRLMEQFGDQTLPPTTRGDIFTIREIAEIFGLHNVGEVTFQSGYKGLQSWSDMRFVADGELTGLIALVQQRVISLNELPPMPQKTPAFTAFTFDAAEAFDVLTSTIREFLSTVNPEEVEQFDEGMERIAVAFGGDIREELVGAMGDVWCTYNDPTPMPIPVGINPVFAASVRDAAKLNGGIEKLMKIVEREAADPNFSIRHTSKDGRETWSFNLSGMPFVPTMTISDKWLVIGVSPGTVQSFFQRVAGKIPAWKPEGQIAEALGELPTDYSSITVSDPAPGYTQALQYAPMALNLIEQQALPNMPGGPRNMPFAPEDLPAVETVLEPMFPNVSVGFGVDNGFGTTSRQSVPSTPVGNISSGAVVPILVALLLPAVQQAREAARRTQSKNNLMQLALAMHNYHDTFNHFPQGTVENDDLKPEERLSWGYSVLPYIEQARLYEKIDKTRGWADPANAGALASEMPVFKNPSQWRLRANPSSGDYVAMAGVGPDAALLEHDDPKAGIFGYNRVTVMRDITDGTSNTLMIIDSSEPNESFLAGGRATVRGFRQSPYLNGPDGIGSPHAGV
ncbi:MAG: DUF1559 domain-containing protein, partial [Planctomycetota bacterium]